MAVYEFSCKTCSRDHSVVGLHEKEAMESRISNGFAICDCGGEISRIYSFSFKRSMPAHYNQSAGTYVSNERQLHDSFKAQSEAASIRTGIEHNFTPVDPQDTERLGVTTEGLGATYDRRKALGMPIPDVVKPSNIKD